MALAEGDDEGVPVDEGVKEAVALPVGVGVAGALGLMLPDAPRDREEVGLDVLVALRLVDAVSVFVALDVGVCVREEDGVREVVPETDRDGDSVTGALNDELGVLLGVREALAPGDKVGVIDGVALAVTSGVADADKVAVVESVVVPVPLCVAVGELEEDGV